MDLNVLMYESEANAFRARLESLEGVFPPGDLSIQAAKRMLGIFVAAISVEKKKETPDLVRLDTLSGQVFDELHELDRTLEAALDFPDLQDIEDDE